MKRISILFFCMLMMVTCKKDADPVMVKVNYNDVEASTSQAVISGSYEYSMEIKSFEILYSEREDMSSSKSVKVYPEGNDFSATLKDLKNGTKYYYQLYFDGEYNSTKLEVMSFTTVASTGSINGYEWVDLGLPSGLRWATCNVGASSTDDYGAYYAWGETEPAPNNDYIYSNCSTDGLSISELQSQGYIDEYGNLTSSHDVATSIWGGTWRMPTESELVELKNNCTWIWVSQGETVGYKVTGPNGNHIYLPAAGYYEYTSNNNINKSGEYWTSTPYEEGLALALRFFSTGQTMNNRYRCRGQSVRPVSGDKIKDIAVTTTNITSVTQNSATSGGSITNDGGVTITARGVCWSKNPNPTIKNSHTTDGSGMGNFTSKITGLVPNTTYYVRAYATNEKEIGYGEQMSFTTLAETPDYNGHEYVDLGLPSGLKWATCNVGAALPGQYGNYYAWGETEPAPNNNYVPSNCSANGLSISELQSQGYIDGEGNLTSSYDAAEANWGGTWRMPTKDDLEELQDYCTLTWTTQNGNNGYKVTGPNGNHIFLPAAGYRYGTSLNYTGERGEYWSATPYESDAYRAYDSYFNSTNLNLYQDTFDRCKGVSVRPVSK